MKRRIFSVITALALCLGLLPVGAWAAEAGEEVSPRATGTEINMDYIESYNLIFAQGVPIVIKQNGSITSIYDTEGNPLSGETDVSSCAIYGGWYDSLTHEASTYIVLESGTVNVLFGGSLYGTLSGNTNIDLNGGTVGWVYGGGNQSTITGTTHVTVNSGAKILGAKRTNPDAEYKGTVFGGGYLGTVSNTEVVFNGGDAGWIYGGGEGGCTCTNTRVRYMGQPDDFMTVSAGGNGGSIRKAVLEFHGYGVSPNNMGIQFYGGGWEDTVEEVQIIVGAKGDPGAAIFCARNTYSTNSTVGSACFEVHWDRDGSTSLMSSSGLDGTGVTGTVTARIFSDAATDVMVGTGLTEIDELIVESGSFTLSFPMNLDRLEVKDSGTAAIPAVGGTTKLGTLAGSGTVLFAKRKTADTTLPVLVDRIDIPDGSRIKVGSIGGYLFQNWAETVVFQGPGVQALSSAACFSSKDAGYYLAKTEDGSGIQVKAGTEQKPTSINPTPTFDKPSYQYGETMHITMGLQSEGRMLSGQLLEIRGGVRGTQTFAAAETGEDGMVSFDLPVDDNLWASREHGLQAMFHATEGYKESFYGVSLENEGSTMKYIVTGAQVALEGEITAPAKGEVPAKALTAGENAVCTAEIFWSPEDVVFRPEVAYTAGIRLVPKQGFRLDGGRLDSVTYRGLPLTIPSSTEADGCIIIPNVAAFDPIPAIHVTGVTLDQTAISLNEGESARLTATITPADADSKAVTWSSSSPAVAAVAADGTVTAVSAGTATITVTTADGGKTASCAVTVTTPDIPAVPVTGVALDKTSLLLAVGGSERLSAAVTPSDAGDKRVSWSSSDPAVAAVAADGTVTAVSAGTATITVTTVNGNKTAVCEVTVGVILPDPPEGDDETRFQLVMETGISAVPEGLTGIETLNTAEKLEAVMKTAITQADTGIPQANTAVYDVALMVSKDGGVNWTPATAENFPAGGLVITLPYPTGTDSSYTFTVVHMFTTSAFSKTPGDTETPTVTNTDMGLRFTVNGLSPISVGWKAAEKPVEPPVTPDRPSTGGGSVSSWRVTVEQSEHGEVSSNRSYASEGSTVTLTVTPDSGYTLDTLTVTDNQGNAIKLTDKGGGKYTFIMPSRAVAVTAGFKAVRAEWESPYSDVASGAWYYEAVRFVSENGLMGGYGKGLFGPNDTLTHAQFAQILFNKEGRPVVNYLLQYGDVATGAWYTEAVRWATSQGIVSGYGNGMFGPNDNITREQLAVMLWRYAGRPAADGTLSFTDADQASGYALEALRWAVENGVMGGYGNGQLAPQGLATRAQVAQMLMNFMKNK